MQKTAKNHAIFWDYNMESLDLSDPKVRIWYLNRKLQFGDFSGIKKEELKKELPNLSIDPSLHTLLQNFLNKYA